MTFEPSSKITAFLNQAGWGASTVVPLVQDASPRQYFRITEPNRTAILMLAPPSSSPPDYAQQAKLANNDCTAFMTVANALSIRGFSAPKILSYDLETGLVLLEDLGDDLFASLLQRSLACEVDLYTAAVSTLAALCRSTFDTRADYQNLHWPLRTYDLTAMLAETALFSDWYLPHLKRPPSTAQKDEMQAAWTLVLQDIASTNHVLVLRDFHAQNLLWLPCREGIAQVGLLDFQDAVFGHPAYDLVSLLQDARRDVSPQLEDPMIDHFIEQAKLPDGQDFRTAYHVLGAQRAAKILGIFARLAYRDNKPRYLSLLPRVEAQFAANLRHGALAPIADLCKGFGL